MDAKKKLTVRRRRWKALATTRGIDGIVFGPWLSEVGASIVRARIARTAWLARRAGVDASGASGAVAEPLEGAATRAGSPPDRPRRLGLLQDAVRLGPDFEERGALTDEDYARLGWP